MVTNAGFSNIHLPGLFALASILIPYLGAALILAIPRRTVKTFSQVIALLAFLASLGVMILFGLQGKTSQSIPLAAIGNLVVFGLVLDRISVLIGLAVILVGFLIVVYSTGYLSEGNREHAEHGIKRRFYIFMLLFIGSMAGFVYSSTMLGLLVFFELTGICSWGLIGYYDDAKARHGAMKAILTTQVASLGLFLATAIFLGAAQTLQLSALAGLDDTMKSVILIGVLIAAWGKSAQLPFHFWLPDAMVAPTPVSAYLHAASMVKVGVYLVARCLISAGQVPPLIGTVAAVMAILTMLYGFAMYFPQKDMKRLLAYSTITQLSYIFLGLALSVFAPGGPSASLAFNGAIAHIFNHAFAKSLFFLVAGALSYTAGTRMLPELRGILRRMPLLGICFAVATLAISGTPPFNCFFSKFSILAGGFAAVQGNPWLTAIVVLAVLETVGSFAWLFWVFNQAVPGDPSPKVIEAGPLPRSMQVVLATLAIFTLISGVFAIAWLG